MSDSDWDWLVNSAHCTHKLLFYITERKLEGGVLTMAQAQAFVSLSVTLLLVQLSVPVLRLMANRRKYTSTLGLLSKRLSLRLSLMVLVF